MPIEILKVGAKKLIKVSFVGDIAILPFYPKDCDGVAWMLLEEGPQGEPGREVTDEEVNLSPRMLGDQEGVLIGATDSRSLDSLIEVATSLRNQLKEKENSDG